MQGFRPYNASETINFNEFANTVRPQFHHYHVNAKFGFVCHITYSAQERGNTSAKWIKEMGKFKYMGYVVSVGGWPKKLNTGRVIYKPRYNNKQKRLRKSFGQ